MACIDTRKNYPRVKEWRSRNKEAMRQAALRARQRRLELMRGAKSKPCTDCGVEYPYYVMQFDHARGTKRFGLAAMSIVSYGMQSIKDEIEKCDVVCANCHAIRTWNRRKNDPVSD